MLLTNLHFAYCPLSAMLESLKNAELCIGTAPYYSRRVTLHYKKANYWKAGGDTALTQVLEQNLESSDCQ